MSSACNEISRSGIYVLNASLARDWDIKAPIETCLSMIQYEINKWLIDEAMNDIMHLVVE